MRQGESELIRDFLDRALSGPRGMVVEGEAGIGKTTLFCQVVELAAARGFRVLSTRGAQTEARYGYAAVADVLGIIVDDALLAELPAVQRTALRRVLLLAGDGPATDERMVATAFLSVLKRPSVVDAPVLVAIDDAHWLDPSSQAVFGYVARRLSGRVAMLATVRTGDVGRGDPLSWLRFARPDAVTRVRLQPHSLDELHRLIAQRLGGALARPAITQIHDISGGNPFFALELGRSVRDNSSAAITEMPETLAAVVRQRVGHLHAELAAVLLAVAGMASPTVERVRRATDLTAERVVELIEEIASRDVIALHGAEIRFSHPLFAAGVYAAAGPARRRAMHHRLADIVEDPELKARHLALADTTGDTATLGALDAAAERAEARGAPAVAAELVELALNRNGDTPVRRFRAAQHHFRSGAVAQARAHLQSCIDALPPQTTLRCRALMLLAAVTDDDVGFVAAERALSGAVDEAAYDPVLQLHARLLLVPIKRLMGRMGEAVELARAAVLQADELGIDDLRSRALALWVTVSFMHGLGVDQQSLRTAVQLEDPHSEAVAVYRASMVAAVVDGWTGELIKARNEMHRLQRGFSQTGTEFDVLWAANHAIMIELWLGCYADAAAIADDTMARADQMASTHLLIMTRSCHAAVAAYLGRAEDARTVARSALDTADRTGAAYLAGPPIMALAFLEVSLANYAAALATLQPLLASFDPDHGTEIVVGAYLPDAVEALTALGRLEEAEPLIAALERNGARDDRPWMLAVGARGRSHLLAARGDLPAAEQAAEQAMVHHRRLPMPFEAARTQLLLGQLRRRQRNKQPAEATLREALGTFERLGTPIWASRARAALGFQTDEAGADHTLTTTQRRVAERAAAGLSNKEIAAELFIAPKTVEMNLSGAYRKLGIRSRGGLSVALQREGDERHP